MIVAFWIFVNAIIDTPERRVKMEARRIVEALELYDRLSLAEAKLVRARRKRKRIVARRAE